MDFRKVDEGDKRFDVVEGKTVTDWWVGEECVG